MSKNNTNKNNNKDKVKKFNIVPIIKSLGNFIKYIKLANFNFSKTAPPCSVAWPKVANKLTETKLEKKE